MIQIDVAFYDKATLKKRYDALLIRYALIKKIAISTTGKPLSLIILCFYNLFYIDFFIIFYTNTDIGFQNQTPYTVLLLAYYLPQPVNTLYVHFVFLQYPALYLQCICQFVSF